MNKGSRDSLREGRSREKVEANKAKETKVRTAGLQSKVHNSSRLKRKETH